jgi:hypothetical protein
MFSIEQLREIDHQNQLSDRELLALRDALFPILEKILDKCFCEEENPLPAGNLQDLRHLI